MAHNDLGKPVESKVHRVGSGHLSVHTFWHLPAKRFFLIQMKFGGM